MLPCFSQEKIDTSSSGSTLDSLHKRIATYLKDGNLKDAIKEYDIVFNMTEKEDSSLLQQICFKFMDNVFLSKDAELKKYSLNIISRIYSKAISAVVLKAFNDSDPQIRELAVAMVSKTNDVSLLPDLTSLLKSTNVNGVISALEVIRRWKEKLFFNDVVPLLDHEDLFVKVAAIEALGEMKTQEGLMKKFSELSSHSSPKIRSAVINAISKLDIDAISLDSMVKDGDPEVRYALVKYIEAHPDKKWERVIRKELSSKDEKIFSAACQASLKNEDLRTLVRWEKLVDSMNAELRYTGAQGLVKDESLLDDTEILFKLLRDPDYKTRVYTAEQLILKKDDSLSQALIQKIFTEGSLEEKKAIIEAWIKNPDIQVKEKYLQDSLNTTDAGMRLISIPLIARLSPDQQIERAQSFLKSNRNNIRAGLFTFISESKNKSLYRQLYQTGLKDSAISVQKETIKGLSLLSENEIDATLISLSTSHFWCIRQACAEQIANLNDETLRWKWINKWIKDKVSDVRTAALKASVYSKEKQKLYDLFSDMLFDPDEKVRSFALTYLQSEETPIVKGEEKTEEKDKEKPKEEKEKPKEAEKPKEPLPDKSKPKQNKLMDWLKAGKGNKKLKDVNLKQGKDDTSELKIDETPVSSTGQSIETKLKTLLNSKQSNVSDQAENWLLEMGDQHVAEQMKTKLSSGSEEERKKAAQKLSIIGDPSLIPLLREQLSKETDVKVQFEIAITIWKLILISSQT